MANHVSVTHMYFSRRSQSNETEPKINLTQSVGLLIDWFRNRT